MLAASLMFAVVCQAQEGKSSDPKLVRTESNGVMIYEAQGVEKVEKLPLKPQVERQAAPTFLELTVPELEERLYHINLKLQLAKDKEDAEGIATYEEHVKQTTERIQALKNGNK